MDCEPMTLEHWKGLLTEVSAGRSLAKDGRSVIWNSATERAMHIIERYRDGQGLFQLVPAKEGEKP